MFIRWSGIGKTRVELVSALKEGTTSSLLAILVVKTKAAEGALASTSASMAGLVYLLSHYNHAT